MQINFTEALSNFISKELNFSMKGAHIVVVRFEANRIHLILKSHGHHIDVKIHNDEDETIEIVPVYRSSRAMINSIMNFTVFCKQDDVYFYNLHLSMKIVYTTNNMINILKVNKDDILPKIETFIVEKPNDITEFKTVLKLIDELPDDKKTKFLIT